MIDAVRARIGRAVAPLRSRWSRRTEPGGAVGAAERDAMTEADIDAAYRLFLGRAPDAEGRAFYRAQVGRWSVHELLPHFVHSHEFRQGEVFRTIVGGSGSVRPATVDLPGRRMVVNLADEAIGAPIAATGTYEPEVTAAVESLLAPGMTFVDVGANIGWFTLLAASLVGPSGTVHAVEPVPANQALLHLGAMRNRFDHVVVHPFAAADRAGSVVIDLASGSNAGLGGRLDDLADRDDAELLARPVVAAERLDRLLADVERVDVIKIDTEGAEGIVLAGAGGLLARHRPALVFEYSPSLLTEVSGITGPELLADLTARHYHLDVVAGPADLDPDAVHAHWRSQAVGHVDLVARPGDG